MSPVHSRPISNERTVPDTTPTAKRTAITCDHRSASVSATRSLRLSPMKFAISTSAGNATPSGTRMMCEPSVNAINVRAASSSAGSAVMPLAYGHERRSALVYSLTDPYVFPRMSGGAAWYSHRCADASRAPRVGFSHALWGSLMVTQQLATPRRAAGAETTADVLVVF